MTRKICLSTGCTNPKHDHLSEADKDRVVHILDRMGEAVNNPLIMMLAGIGAIEAGSHIPNDPMGLTNSPIWGLPNKAAILEGGVVIFSALEAAKGVLVNSPQQQQIASTLTRLPK